MKNQIKLIAVTGKMGHGKDTVADIINNYTMYTKKSFAQKLKLIASIILNTKIERFDDRNYKNSLLPSEWGNITVRTFLQKLGVSVRNGIHVNFWVNALFSEYNEYSRWVISDLRFKNELQAVIDRGGVVIRVFRPGIIKVWFNDDNNSDEEDSSGVYYIENVNFDKEKNQSIYTIYNDNGKKQVTSKNLHFYEEDLHISEIDLDNEPIEHVIINDGNIKDLHEKVKNILIKLEII